MIPTGIGSVVCVLTTVSLDYKTALKTSEVNDVGLDDMLPTEFQIRQAAVAEHAP